MDGLVWVRRPCYNRGEISSSNYLREMSPRKYDMTKRAEALEATRKRIVDATVAAHRELGIQATSWDEIASRAEVGVGTVYRHFRSLDELLPACGALVTETLALPADDELPPCWTALDRSESESAGSSPGYLRPMSGARPSSKTSVENVKTCPTSSHGTSQSRTPSTP